VGVDPQFPGRCATLQPSMMMAPARAKAREPPNLCCSNSIARPARPPLLSIYGGKITNLSSAGRVGAETAVLPILRSAEKKRAEA